MENGLSLEYFHCVNDRRIIRDQVFAVLAADSETTNVHSLIVDKPAVSPALRAEERFLPQMLGVLLSFALSREVDRDTEQVIVIIDTPPLKRLRHAIEKIAKEILTIALPAPKRHGFWTHQSRSHYGLQVADYYGWAIFKKYENQDTRAYAQIASAVSSELRIFPPAQDGTIEALQKMTPQLLPYRESAPLGHLSSGGNL